MISVFALYTATEKFSFCKIVAFSVLKSRHYYTNMAWHIAGFFVDLTILSHNESIHVSCAKIASVNEINSQSKCAAQRCYIFSRA